MFEPNKYHLDIFKFLEKSNQNFVISATAGSGKTTTLCQITKKVDCTNAAFLAFNKSIAVELQERLPDVRVHTLNSLGHRLLMECVGGQRLYLDNFKYGRIAREVFSEFLHTEYGYPKVITDPRLLRPAWVLAELVDFTMLTNTNPTNFDELLNLVKFYGVDLSNLIILQEELFSLVNIVRERGLEEFLSKRSINFNDQIVLPVSLAYQGSFQFDFVFGDEIQDWSVAQCQLVASVLSPTGRFIGVGDPHQSIYGFAGADVDSFSKVKKQFNAKEFPLKLTYRCPKSVVTLARTVNSEIEALETADEGKVDTILDSMIFDVIKPSDLVVSRTNAPLIELTLNLLKKGIPSKIIGHDLENNFLSFARRVSKSKTSRSAVFGVNLQKYYEVTRELLVQKHNSEEHVDIIKLDDNYAVVNALWRYYIDDLPVENKPTDFESFHKAIKTVFKSKKGESRIKLASIHRAKGLEADRVFFLNPQKSPLCWENQQKWEYVQEINLKFVAITRAKQSLFLVYPLAEDEF